MQTVTIDGQEAIFIPTGGVGAPQQVQLGSNQALLTSNGQIIRGPGGQTSQLPAGFTLQNVVGQQSQNVAVRSGNVQQVLQLPMQQAATISVQVPVSTANGQTVYQTLQLPVQMISSGMPGLVQSGTQMQVLQQLTQVGTNHYHHFQMKKNSMTCECIDRILGYWKLGYCLVKVIYEN